MATKCKGKEDYKKVATVSANHDANIGAWTRLTDIGVVVRVWRVHVDTMTLRLQDLDPLLGPRTTWVAMTQASNILGTVNPVAEVAPGKLILFVAQRDLVGLRCRPVGDQLRKRAERLSEAGDDVLSGHLLASSFTRSNR